MGPHDPLFLVFLFVLGDPRTGLFAGRTVIGKKGTAPVARQQVLVDGRPVLDLNLPVEGGAVGIVVAFGQTANVLRRRGLEDIPFAVIGAFEHVPKGGKHLDC